MPIHRIALKNFKCFKETDVELSRITVLTGENSSGKSSLIYGILAPFQSEGFPVYLSPNGKYVNMGDFKEMSFKNLKNNEIEIDISGEYQDEHWQEYKYSYKTTWGIDLNSKMPTFKHGVINNKEFDTETGEDYKKRPYQKNGAIYFRNDLFFEIKDNLNFIGPFRFQPERTYYRKATAYDKIGVSGEGYIDKILEWEQHKAPQFKKLISILKKLNLINSLKTQQLKGGRFEVNVKTKYKGVWASLADVGFGISQFLPVIVADLQLPNDSTLLLAQPEIHLHPSIQASLADYFVNQIRETGKQYIIETHSEYLLNRFRLDIVKGILDPADISVYYFEPSPDGSITYRIEFTKDGQIKNAPKGFFDTYMIDTMDIALYA